MKSLVKISFLVALICILYVGTTSAQVRFGMKGGVDVISNDINSTMLDVKNRLGYQVGFTTQFFVPLSGLGLEVSALYGHRDYKTESEYSNQIKNYSYVMVPVYAKKSITLLGIAGIYIKGGVYGTGRLSGGEVTINDQEYTPKKFQYGLAAGVGVSLFNRFELGMDYRHRLEKAYTADALTDLNFNKMNRNSWTVSTTFFF